MPPVPRRPPPVAEPFAPRFAKKVPFDFVLDELDSLAPRTNPMFGCLAVYVGEKIVLVLRDRASEPQDNGVWVVTVREHQESLRLELPSMRPITVLGATPSAWQVIPKEGDSFEDEVLRACALLRARDPRIGKVPKARRPAAPTAKTRGGARKPPR
jgi:hypothetical protein